MSNKDRSIQTHLIIDQETLDRSYQNETLDWQSLKLKSTTEHLFVNCTFPLLFVIEIERPVAFTFIGCTFPKLLIADVNSSVDCVFGFCSFPPSMLPHIDDPIFSRCRCSGLEHFEEMILVEEETTEISTLEEETSETILDITKEKRRMSFEVLPEDPPEIESSIEEFSEEILDITQEPSIQVVKVFEHERVTQSTFKFSIKDSYL